jgi:hypothetical protein
MRQRRDRQCVCDIDRRREGALEDGGQANSVCLVEGQYV